MNKHSRKLLAAAVLSALSAAAGAAVVTPELRQQMAAAAPGQALPVIVQLADRVDVRQLRPAARNRRSGALVAALKDKAARTQAPVAAAIAAQGGSRLRQLWIINGIAARLSPAAVERLAGTPGVGRIGLDASVSAPVTTQAAGAPPEWNLAAVHAPDLWALGHTGAGMVVANMDTGVDPDHPDLAANWRGGANSWFDPHGEHAMPHDVSGHGTQTMGLMAGGSAGGSAIGVAPDAKWIAAKVFDDAGGATLSDIHLAFQWLLDPDGNPGTADTPDVVNASWGLIGGAPGACNLEFNDDIVALKTAGIAVVFSAGNDGPGTATSQSPANNPAGFAAGAVDSQSVVAGTSSRGPSGCDASIFPKLVAPGVNVLTADLSFGGLPLYATVSGTSFAAPHVAGLMTLLGQAFPAATVGELEGALVQGAADLGAAGADNAYGYGLADGAAALAQLAGSGSPPSITSIPVTSANQDQSYSYQATASDPDGGTLGFSLDTAPAGMTVGAASGLVTWTPGAAQVGANAVTLRVTDPTGLTGFQSFSVAVAAANRPPLANNDAYGVTQGASLNVPAPGVLGNDSDPDGDALTAVLTTPPGNGSLTLNADGSFAYTPAAGYAGTDSFGYAALDGKTTGNTTSVTIAVSPANQPPVAANDSFTAPVWRSGTYTPKVFAVLANDSDADGTLNPASVTIAANPNRGGKVRVNGDGTVSYTPKLRFSGTETFKYTVKDNQGLASNVATVTVSVR